MSKIVISLGQMPAKLDAVKYIGNRFSGGLMVKLAIELANLGHEVHLVKWKYNTIELPDTMGVTNVDDILEYYSYIEKTPFDAYILGAAVANLMPVSPWKGKFPSHNYSEGDEFDIKFKIAPRIINIVKKNHPRSTLIGFKLSTGTYFDAFETLKESNADLVIYNNPKNLNEVTFCYKTFMVKNGVRDEIAERIHYLLGIKYHVTPERSSTFSEKIDLHAFFQIKELEKYVLDENRHGAIAINTENGLYVHTRYNKYVGVYDENRYIDNKLEVYGGSEKYTEALPVFLLLHKMCPKHKYFIHTHKELPIKDALLTNYIPPNANVDSISDYIKDYKRKSKCIIKSECHGFFMSFEKLNDVLDLLTSRNWVNYDPPTRYINDNSDIFDDILSKEYFTNNAGLEIGGNEFTPSKVFENHKIKRHVIDPYFEKGLPALYDGGDNKKFELIVAKNCAPIIGLDILKLYSKLTNRMIFNFPKQYVTDRVVDCLYGSKKREISFISGDTVYHSLLYIEGESKEGDVHHSYDMVTEEKIYNLFHKEFEIYFRYTDRGVWCYMKKMS